MRYSTIIAALFSGATIVSADITARQTTAVATAINAWINDINYVNDFLNGGQTTLQTAFTMASDEPNQLMVLAAVTGLPVAGTSAAARLMATFPSVPANLGDLLKNSDATAAAVTTITYDRCCTILPSIQDLFVASAAAVGDTYTGTVPLPNQCAQFTCQIFTIG